MKGQGNRARTKKTETLQYRKEEAEEGYGQSLQSQGCGEWRECVLLFVRSGSTGTRVLGRAVGSLFSNR